MRKKRRTFEAGFLDPAREAGLADAALELGLTLEAVEAGLEVLDAGLAAVSETGSVVAGAWDTLEEGALAFDAGLVYEITYQMSQKR